MSKIRKEDKLPLHLKQLGKIYRLIEQFEEISRIDLSKLSRLAPATITALTRELIEKKLIIERTVQNTEARGRPAVGLCVSPFYWQSLCAVLAENHFDILLCELDGTPIIQRVYPLNKANLVQLEQVLIKCLQNFLLEAKHKLTHPFVFSIAVAGQLNKSNGKLYRLGQYELSLDLKAIFEPHFDIPVLVTEYFETWLLAESTLGTVIGCNNVLFLQIDDVINLSVLSQGNIICANSKEKMNIDKMIVPHFNPIQKQINAHLPEIQRYQAINQISHQAICQLVDEIYPDNKVDNPVDKIRFCVKKRLRKEKSAVEILQHFADVIAYLLMNLINLFSSKKVMLSSDLLTAKDIFLPYLNERLAKLIEPERKTEVITGQYKRNNTVVITAGIKQKIYDGSLLIHLM